MYPGADVTDLRGRPCGRVLEVSESAGHDFRIFDRTVRRLRQSRRPSPHGITYHQYIVVVGLSAMLVVATFVDCFPTGWLCMDPGADATDSRCWPSGQRLVCSESAGHDCTYPDDWASRVLASCDLEIARHSPLAPLYVVSWFCMAPGADFTDLRSWPCGRWLEQSESAGLVYEIFYDAGFCHWADEDSWASHLHLHPSLTVYPAHRDLWLQALLGLS
jgi:hypothetical protein